jgi:hypothetical protein
MHRIQLPRIAGGGINLVPADDTPAPETKPPVVKRLPLAPPIKSPEQVQLFLS